MISIDFSCILLNYLVFRAAFTCLSTVLHGFTPFERAFRMGLKMFYDVFRPTLDELSTLLVGDLHELLGVGRAQEVDDHVQLVLSAAPGEERLSRLHLGQDAADRPNVDGA